MKRSDITQAKEKNQNKRKYISWEDNPFTALRANLNDPPEFEDSCSFCHFKHSGGNYMQIPNPHERKYALDFSNLGCCLMEQITTAMA